MSSIASKSYIGQKGYTIPKSELSVSELEFLKKELFLKPETHGPSFGPTEDVAFPVYRENDNKIYIPRFYGIGRYGMPPRNDLAPGEDINVSFTKGMRDYQETITNAYIEATKPPSGGILEIYCGAGKTVMALNLVARIQKKTLILVHKEFLMNQWIERIAEFLPGARVGKIQANVCDTANKDIVIGMIQTMYNKTFPQEVYSQFGMTIIDEVHRIGSEEFSKTLLKTITPYMLGISATVERKDGLTKLLHMFIGPTIYSLTRKQEDVVSVRGIEYTTRDADFNEVEYDFRGYPKYSTMISKLCAYCPRSDFIIRVIYDLLSENPDSQIMVLAHNRSLLKYLYENIVSLTHLPSPATIGYYVGGMKQTHLQETETKQIVLATYAMAAEALDIKTLSTLVMITPKTDITQSVGRILRMKHENPIIVDIIDTHDLFQNQWTQRKRWYKKNNYKISTTNSVKYRDMRTTNWFVAFEPKTTDKNKQKCADVDDKPVYTCAIDVSAL